MNKYPIIFCLSLLLLSCGSTPIKTETDETVDQIRDSIETIIIAKVEAIMATDSLMMIPSLRYSKGESETYSVKQYLSQQSTLLVNTEAYSNNAYEGLNIYYDQGYPIFMVKVRSSYEPGKESYHEEMIFLNGPKVYNAYEKTVFTEDAMFEDTLFTKTTFDLASIDFDKPVRALSQTGEFQMYFDEFLLIEPQSYLIVENGDSSMNAAIYIKESDALLDDMFDFPEKYVRKKIKINHYFEEMNGVERMIYGGANIVED